MIIKQLEYDDYKGKKYKAEILSNEYLSIEPEGDRFEIIGFDRYAYSNHDPENHDMRIEMGRKL